MAPDTPCTEAQAQRAPCPYCGYTLCLPEQTRCPECGSPASPAVEAEALMVRLTWKIGRCRTMLLVAALLMLPSVHLLMAAYIYASGGCLLIGFGALLAGSLLLVGFIPGLSFLLLSFRAKREYKAAYAACTAYTRGLLDAARKRATRSLILVIVVGIAYWVGFNVLWHTV